VTVEGDVFVLLAMDDSPIITAAAREVRRVLPSYLDGRFATLPVKPVYILLFSTFTGFDDWSQKHYGVDGHVNLGSYQRSTREMAVDLTDGEKAIPTIFHEMLHVFTEADWKHMPRWFDECFGSVYESPRWDAAGRIHGAKWSRRYKLVTDTLANPATAPSVRFDTLFGMSDDEFRGIDPSVGMEATARDPKLLAAARKRALLHYGVARYMCVYLENQGLLLPLYTAMREGAASDPRGEATFTRIVGVPPSGLQERWAAWVKLPGDAVPAALSAQPPADGGR
jgi:hypothetical protein